MPFTPYKKESSSELTPISDLMIKKYQEQSAGQQMPSLTETATGKLPVIKQLTEFGTGIGTELGKQVLNVPQGILKASQKVSDVIGAGADYSKPIQAIETAKQKVFEEPFQKELGTGFGKAGEITGKVAPYIATAGTTQALTQAATAPVKGFKGAGLARTAIGAGTEALSNFIQSYGLTGGDTKEAKTQALVTGGLSFATKGLDEIAKAIKLPEKLMGVIYKSDKKEIENVIRQLDDDVLTKAKDSFKYNTPLQLKSEGFDDLANKISKVNLDKVKNIDELDQYLSKKLGKEALDNKVVKDWITETKNVFEEYQKTKNSVGEFQQLRTWALDKGLKGGLLKQAKDVQKILNKSEDEVIKSARASGVKIPVEDNLKGLAQEIQADYAGVGRGEIAQKASQFLNSLDETGKVDVESAIKFRRLLDNTLRTKTSFNKPVMADNLAYWAEDLRKFINEVGGIGKINKDYSMAMKARDALINAAKSSNNSKALGALEAYFLGGGMATGLSVPAIATVAAKRASQSPRLTTNLAQSLVKGATKKGVAARSVIGQGINQVRQTIEK